jgi:sugar/nucleoside kinase (ribokinase family)
MTPITHGDLSVAKIQAFSEFNNIFEKIFEMKRILGIGNALVDVMTIIDDDAILENFNLPKGSMQLVDSEVSAKIKSETVNFKVTRVSGGSVANTIHGLAMLGVDTGFIGAIGKDETGDLFETDMKHAGVNTLLFRKNTVTGTAIALISPDSERTFATHLGAAVELSADDLKPMLFEGYDILYPEGYLISNPDLFEKACTLARSNNMLVALDLSSYNVVEAYLGSFKRIVANYVDILFANELEVKAYTGLEPEKALDFLSGPGRTIIIKIGARGSLIRQGDENIKVDIFPVTCTDTTGAGDLYAAGFLYGYSRGLGIEKCGLVASLMAASVIETLGARLDESRLPEIRSKIREIVEE